MSKDLRNSKARGGNLQSYNVLLQKSSIEWNRKVLLKNLSCVLPLAHFHILFYFQSHVQHPFLKVTHQPFHVFIFFCIFQVDCLPHKILHAWHKRHSNVRTCFWWLFRWKKKLIAVIVGQQVQSNMMKMEIYLILIKCKLRFVNFDKLWQVEWLQRK